MDLQQLLLKAQQQQLQRPISTQPSHSGATCLGLTASTGNITSYHDVVAGDAVASAPTLDPSVVSL